MLQTLRDGGIVTLVLERPERGNALSAGFVESLIAAAGRAMEDAGVHTLILRGAGRHFCTGLDLSDPGQTSDGELLHRLVRIETLLAGLWHAPVRTVAVAQGRTWGAGADLFAACEERVALPGCTFRFPGAGFGIVLGTRRLAERIGTDKARRIVVEGTEVDADEALRAGLANTASERPWTPPRVAAATAAAVRAVTRADHRDADLAALVRSAAEPGLRERIAAYRDALKASTAGEAPQKPTA
jgi:enoyl-CoA hydratase/carnithine racemase